MLTVKPLGRGGVPKFFWGGQAARAAVVVSSDQRLILMGVWCDPSQPHEKKRARFEDGCWKEEERFKLAASAAKKDQRAIDCCRLMGVTVIPALKRIAIGEYIRSEGRPCWTISRTIETEC
jgi:hypothetical protein